MDLLQCLERDLGSIKLMLDVLGSPETGYFRKERVFRELDALMDSHSRSKNLVLDRIREEDDLEPLTWQNCMEESKIRQEIDRIERETDPDSWESLVEGLVGRLQAHLACEMRLLQKVTGRLGPYDSKYLMRRYLEERARTQDLVCDENKGALAFLMHEAV